jgi:uncharacterized RDD family membrane protein YckC
MAANPVAIAAPAYGYAQVAYAGFWLRFLAYLIDALVLSVCFVAVIIPLIFLTGLGSSLEKIHPGEDPGEIGALLGVTAIFAFVGIAVVGTWIYHAYLESSDWQATVGKRALNLKVTDLEGRPVSFGRASGRHFAKIISGLIPLGIGYFIAGFTDKKQAIHDMVASCLVLRNL